MRGVEPNAMPQRGGAHSSDFLWFSLVSVAISDHLRSSRFPALVHEPRKMTVERNRAPVAHPRRAHADNRAAQNASANASALCSHFDLQFHTRPGQQALTRLDQRAAG